MEVYLTKPKNEDLEELRRLFTLAFIDAYQQEGIEDLDGVKDEVATQIGYVREYLACQDEQVYFLIARTDEQIVGTIAYNRPNELIRTHLKMDLYRVLEISSAYVLPEFQGQGVGTLLFNAILLTLLQQGCGRFCLDGGFKRSQRFWQNKLGTPTVMLKNYWGAGLDHLIWLRNLEDVKIRYQL